VIVVLALCGGCEDQAQLLGEPVDLTPALVEIHAILDSALAADAQSLSELAPHNGALSGLDTCLFAGGATLATWNWEYPNPAPEVAPSFILTTSGAVVPLSMRLPLDTCIGLGARLAVVNSCGAIVVDPVDGIVATHNVEQASCGWWPFIGRGAEPGVYLRVTDTFSTWIQASRFTLADDGTIGTPSDTSSVHISIPSDAGSVVPVWVREIRPGEFAAVWVNEAGQLFRRDPSGAVTAVNGVTFDAPAAVFKDALFDRRFAAPEAVRVQSDDTLRVDLGFGTESARVLTYDPVADLATFFYPMFAFDPEFTIFGEPVGVGAAMARTVTPNPQDSTLEVPTALQARGIYIDAPAVLDVPLTPCVDADTCRRAGESELLGVIGWEAGMPTALYRLWAWRREGSVRGGQVGGGGWSDLLFGIYARPVPLGD